MPIVGHGSSSRPARIPWFVVFLQGLPKPAGSRVAPSQSNIVGRRDASIASAELAAEFVRLKVDVIAAPANNRMAAKQATSTIPIVFALAEDPVEAGLVASLARPGGNVTGMSLQQTEVAGKRLGLLREVVPGCAGWRSGKSANPRQCMKYSDLQALNRTLGLGAVKLETGTEEIAAAFEGSRAARTPSSRRRPALQSPTGSASTPWRSPRAAGDATIRQYVEAGGLMSYGTSFLDMYRRAADLCRPDPRGAKPADMPVEQPTKFELVINLKIAKALGLEVPPTLLARADEVIE